LEARFIGMRRRRRGLAGGDAGAPSVVILGKNDRNAERGDCYDQSHGVKPVEEIGKEHQKRRRGKAKAKHNLIA